MKHGFVKTAAITPECRVADTAYNCKKILQAIDEAERAGAELAVFPELCLSGATCGDLFLSETLQAGAWNALKLVCSHTLGKKMIVFVGLPVRHKGKLYNCAAAVCGGLLLGLVPKRYGEKRGVWDRCFSSGEGVNGEVTLLEQKAPIRPGMIFSDCVNREFSVGAEFGEELLSPCPPSIALAEGGANAVVCLAAFPAIAGKNEFVSACIQNLSEKTNVCYVLAGCGAGESTTDFVFSAQREIYECGERLKSGELFENGMIVSEIDLGKAAFLRTESGICNRAPSEVIPFETWNRECALTRTFEKLPFVREAQGENRAELILSAQAMGLKKRMEHIGAKKAVIGVSGGLDSTLALLVVCRALALSHRPASDILAVTLPGFGTGARTKESAVRLMKALGCTAAEIDISAATTVHLKDIGHGGNADTTFENAQARMRTLILMDLANLHGGLVVGTGDLSELALGFATYNGDHMSMYGVNAGVSKTLVKYLVEHEADRLGGETGEVLRAILNTEISPELLPAKEGETAQKTEEIVGPYELTDFFLYHAFRSGWSPKKMRYAAGLTFAGVYDDGTILKWLTAFYRRFFSQQFKRSCLPDGVKVASVGLSPRGGLTMPSDAAFELWTEELK